MFDLYEGDLVNTAQNRPIETKYLPFICSSVRFLTDLAEDDCPMVVTGSWMEEVNRISLWQYDVSFKLDERAIEVQSELEDVACIGVIGDNKDEPRILSSLVHDGDVLGLSVNKERRLVFSSSSSGSVSIYQLDSGTQQLKRVLKEPFYPDLKNNSAIGCISQTRDASKLFMGDDLGNLHVLDVENGGETIQTVGKTTSGINAVQTLDSNIIACVTQSGVLHVYDTRKSGTQASCYKAFRPGGCSPLLCLAQHPGYPYLLAVGGYSEMAIPAYIWDLRDYNSNPAPLAELSVPGEAIWDIKFNPIQPNQLFIASHEEGLMCISPEVEANEGIVWCSLHSKRPRLGISAGIQGSKVKNCHTFDMTNSKVVTVNDEGLMMTASQNCSLY